MRGLPSRLCMNGPTFIDMTYNGVLSGVLRPTKSSHIKMNFGVARTYIFIFMVTSCLWQVMMVFPLEY